MEFMEVLKKRRSVRKYTDDPVLLEDIKKMIEAATLAPSAHNSRPWRFAVVTSGEKIRAVAAEVHRAMDQVLASTAVPDDLKEQYEKFRLYFTFYENAPVLIVACGEPFYSVPSHAVSLAFPEKYKQSRVSSLEQSVSAAIENLILAATDMGYGTCWATGPLLAAENIKQVLGLPESWIIFALIPVGRPLREPRPKKGQAFEEVAILID